MKLTFLQAPMPLTKTYTKGPAGITKSPYPHAYEVTSHEESCTNLAGFLKAVQKHAALNHCLLKGNIARPLVNESRAGSTDSTAATEWICLDIDGLPDSATVTINDAPVQAQVTVDDLLFELGLGDVSYVLQWSASYGISDTSLRAHVFMLLDKPMAAPLLKQWLIQLNHTSPLLSAAMGLTKTGNAISWPLDISACQNDKLIYIAPPTLRGLKDPLGGKHRITLVKKKHERLTITGAINSTSTNQELTTKAVDRLREVMGMPKRKTTFKRIGPVDVMVKPDQCVITEMKEERGFVYFNLNGGDSWAYYHPVDNPKYIFNFKGEPAYLTEELLPDYWSEILDRGHVANAAGAIKLAFLNPVDDQYYRGTYDSASDTLSLDSTRSAKVLTDYAALNNIPIRGNNIPEIRMYFDPQDNVRVDLTNRVINTFAPTVYMRAVARKTKVVPHTIQRVLWSVVGSDKSTYDHFVNWLAYVLQNRDRACTAWVFHGTTGTGKGILKNKILRPLFGDAHVALPRMDELAEKFNTFLDHSLLVFVDEAEINAMLNSKQINANLKVYITEEMVNVRAMRTAARAVRNYTSWIFASNRPEPVFIAQDDRRFNVGHYQTQKLELTPAEIDSIESELQNFHDYLLFYDVDVQAAQTPLNNSARQELMNLGENAIDTVANAVLRGDMSFFLDQLPTDDSYKSVMSTFNKVENYKRVLKALLERTREDGKCSIARDELRVMFEYTVDNVPSTPNKFTSMLKHHRLPMDKVWVDKKTVNGVAVTWSNLESWAEYQDRLAGGPGTSACEPSPEPTRSAKKRHLARVA